MKFEKSELFGKSDVRNEQSERLLKNPDRDWLLKRTEYFFRNLIKERNIDIGEEELDSIDYLFSSNNYKGLVTVYGNTIRQRTDGGYETAHKDDSKEIKPFKDLTAQETDEFLHRYKFDALIPLWGEASEMADKEGDSQTSPESTPPSLPPDARYLQKDETLSQTMGTAFYSEKLTDGRHNHYPKIGAFGLSTRYGRINGVLIWCDGESAIFDTPQGKLRIRFTDVVSPSGKTYGELVDEERDEEVHREKNTKLRYRSH
ncbi:MAG: hypothetical protein NUW00_04520 [Candidatus Kaiserbacteria bacterium]|nr:hypothetical protein [Candidatus Kaiserbacteria bacterium]